jgi:scyllo-inositol 2-dehydrogenase (NADP+)
VIRVGLVGYGLAGAVFHAPLIEADERLELTAVLTSRPHPRQVEQLDDLLARSDLVVIASPNESHFPLAMAALESGKHVVVDKPFTVTVAQADALIALARQQQRLLTVFHNRRWDADFLTVQKVLPRIGELLLFEANWDRFRPAIKAGWREAPMPGSGVLNDLGPHLVDQAIRLFGLPGAISADILTQRSAALVDDYFDLTLDYGLLRVCLRCSSLVSAPRPRFGMHGRAGSYVKYGLDPQELQLKGGMDPREPDVGVDVRPGVLTLADGTTEEIANETGRYRTFYAGVAAAILDGAPVPVDPEDARDGLLLIDLARRAAAAGQRLPVPAASSQAK